ncbi:MAG: hypothetical protein HY369_02430 [Candidatus Aenigmarchaeota archaeon]|nr:hypothetical protein [Candidatus Aenigmarchaeota archaeon]
MVNKDLILKLDAARDVADVFEVVKAAVRDALGRSRAGLMLGLSPLGFASQGFVGAYHQMGSNLIVMNATLLKRIEQQSPDRLIPYTFHLLLHEYLHSLGVVDEPRTRATALLVSTEIFGDEHIVTKIADNFEAFLPGLAHPGEGYQPPASADVTLIQGFDREATRYIG